MAFIIIIIAFFVAVFIGAILSIKVLNRMKLKSSLKKKIKGGSKTDTINALKKVIEKNPFDMQSRMELVKLYIEENNFNEAIKELNSILTNARKDPGFNPRETNKLLAECYLNVDKLDNAAKVFSILRKEYPNDPYAYIELGKLEKERGNIERATKYFAKASSLDPENMDSVSELGILLFDLKKYPESLTTLQTVLTKQPDDPTVNYYLGELRVIYDNPKEAFNHFLKAKKDPRYTLNSLLNISFILRRYDKLDDARKVLATALRLPDLKKDEIVETLYQLGEICLAQKDVQAAIDQWEKILTRVKDYKDVKTKLEKYEQTKTSSFIRTYMMASRSDFTEICKKAAIHAAVRVIIIRTEPQADSSIEIFTQAVHHDVPTTILFKFFRGSSKIGQLAIREFYETLKETKAKHGICYTTADYSDEAIEFSSGRVIELLGKNDLIKLLGKSLKKAPSSSK